jgi:hypothetical protein
VLVANIGGKISTGFEGLSPSVAEKLTSMAAASGLRNAPITLKDATPTDKVIARTVYMGVN